MHYNFSVEKNLEGSSYLDVLSKKERKSQNGGRGYDTGTTLKIPAPLQMEVERMGGGCLPGSLSNRFATIQNA
jgi:hypothetical protein